MRPSRQLQGWRGTTKVGTTGGVGHIVGESTCSSTNYFEIETAPTNSISNVGNKTIDAYEGSHGERDSIPIDESLPEDTDASPPRIVYGDMKKPTESYNTLEESKTTDSLTDHCTVLLDYDPTHGSLESNCCVIRIVKYAVNLGRPVIRT